jgi:hypothetical protein
MCQQGLLQCMLRAGGPLVASMCLPCQHTGSNSRKLHAASLVLVVADMIQPVEDSLGLGRAPLNYMLPAVRCTLAGVAAAVVPRHGHQLDHPGWLAWPPFCRPRAASSGWLIACICQARYRPVDKRVGHLQVVTHGASKHQAMMHLPVCNAFSGGQEQESK